MHFRKPKRNREQEALIASVRKKFGNKQATARQWHRVKKALKPAIKKKKRGPSTCPNIRRPERYRGSGRTYKQRCTKPPGHKGKCCSLDRDREHAPQKISEYSWWGGKNKPKRKRAKWNTKPRVA